MGIRAVERVKTIEENGAIGFLQYGSVVEIGYLEVDHSFALYTVMPWPSLDNTSWCYQYSPNEASKSQETREWLIHHDAMPDNVCT